MPFEGGPSFVRRSSSSAARPGLFVKGSMKFLGSPWYPDPCEYQTRIIDPTTHRYQTWQDQKVVPFQGVGIRPQVPQSESMAGLFSLIAMLC
jgi:hypothetical protein